LAEPLFFEERECQSKPFSITSREEKRSKISCKGFPQSRVNQPSPPSKKQSTFSSPVPRCVFYSTNVLMSDSGIISQATIANPRVTLDSQDSRMATFSRRRKPPNLTFSSPWTKASNISKT